MKRIGIYGGTFNPPHLGHFRAAQYALRVLSLDALLVIPSCISPHKKLPAGSADPRQRLEMTKLCFEDGAFTVSDIELSRGGTSYTYETVESLRAQYPDTELVLLMGTDMFLSFLNWVNPERILSCVSLGVFYRGDRDEVEAVAKQKKCLEEKGAKVYLMDNPVTEISSTDLRRMLVFDCADAYLSPKVLDYIKSKGLYGCNENLHALPEEKLEEVVKGLLKPNRVAHVLGCRDTAVELAKLWGADPVHAARAALLHDVTKALDGPLQLTLCDAYGIILNNFSTQNPKTLHALTGSLVAERIFGEAPEIVSAIRSHTTGKAGMNTLEKIIYVADYMEPNRDFPGVEELRYLARTDLDGALRRGLEMTLEVLKQEGKEISPESREALDFLNKS